MTDKFVELEAKTLKLLEVIESLGEYLNSDDGSIRAKSWSYNLLSDM